MSHLVYNLNNIAKAGKLFFTSVSICCVWSWGVSSCIPHLRSIPFKFQPSWYQRTSRITQLTHYTGYLMPLKHYWVIRDGRRFNWADSTFYRSTNDTRLLICSVLSSRMRISSRSFFFFFFFWIRSMADVDVFSFWEADRVGSGFLQISPLRLTRWNSRCVSCSVPEPQLSFLWPFGWTAYTDNSCLTRIHWRKSCPLWLRIRSMSYLASSIKWHLCVFRM